MTLMGKPAPIELVAATEDHPIVGDNTQAVADETQANEAGA